MRGSGRTRLLLFAREPEPGRVKTRLARSIGAERASALYGAFLADLASALVSREWESVLAADGRGGGRLERIFASGWSVTEQGAGSLGDRLTRAAVAAFEQGIERVVLAGSDAPTLSGTDVRAALSALAVAAVAAAPAPDGGFTLLALRPPASPRRLFDSVRWSTPFALSDVRRNASAAALGMALLTEIPDVDVAGDLPALRRRLATDPRIAPATRVVLEAL